MRSALTRISAVLITLLMVVSLLPAAVFAAADRTVVYEVRSAGVQQTKITKNNLVSIIVRISDSTLMLNTTLPAEEQVNAYKLVDSFNESSTAAVSYSISSATEYSITFDGLIYNGNNQSFIFKTSENNKASYTKETLTIDEAVPYVEPVKPEPQYDPPTPIDPPLVVITIDSAPEIVKAKDEFEVKFTVENKGTKTLNDVYANFDATANYRLDGYKTKISLASIGAKKSASFTAKFKASEALDAEYIPLGIELQYTYYNNVQTTSGTTSETFYITAQKKEEKTDEPKEIIPEPVVIVTGSVIDTITAKKEFDYTVTFTNKGTTALTSPVVKLSCGGDLTLKNESTTVLIPDIPAGGKGTVTLKLKAADKITSPMQDVSVSMKYYYDDGNGVINTAGNVSETFDLAAVVTKEEQSEGPIVIASPVPNVIITDYSFGGDNVTAGEPFDLDVTFRNTGRVAIENIVCVVDGGQNFTINGATNTTYYNSVGANATQTLSVPLQTLATANTGAQNVGISFQYEYVDNKVRSQNSSSINISIPVSQPDRLEFGEPVMYDYMAYTGMETTIVLEYVNKGKSEVANVEAEVIGDVDALQQSQYLGNFGSGMSGNISFVLTPWMSGMTDVTFKITYEDANGDTVSREIPFSFQVEDMNYDEPAWDDPGMIDEPVEEEGFFAKLQWWAWAIAGLVVLAAAGLTAKGIKKKKARKAVKAAESEWNVFDEASENKEA